MKWTSDQQKVIETRNSNILVSAAAGSGKTAVLVERIVSMVCGDLDGEEPVDVDRLLVVTFTRAAAAEMRERIGLSLGRRLAADTGNVHLQRQQSLIHTAQITTIDSFCLHVVRTYFHLTDIDPSFRTGDEGELRLLRGEVVKELLEEHYADEDKASRDAFTEFIECYAPGRSDAAVEDMILDLYEFSVSYPDPAKWLDSCAAFYEARDAGDLESSSWMKYLMNMAGDTIADLRTGVSRMIELTKEADGPYMYQDALTEDAVLLGRLSECESYGDLHAALKNLSFARLSGRKDENVDPDKREEIKLFRDGMKKNLKDLQKKYFSLSLEEELEEIRQACGPTKVLIKLTGEFSVRYAQKKRQKNIADFQDIEHMALHILTKSVDVREDGTVDIVQSEAAKELSSKYVQIMTDEYQDSNLIQETVINSVAYGQGIPNIFMVGDVKQSIYSFRKARPSLFMEKYDRYSKPRQADGVLITLGKNFRSRRGVIDGVNYVFRRLMKTSVGGVYYGEREELYQGAEYPDDEGDGFTPEILILEDESLEGLSGSEDLSACELEAHAAAMRIKRLMREGWVHDAGSGRPAPVRYRDIVILLRSLGAQGDAYARVLNAEGIPAHTESRTGYFSAPEVQTVLNLLKTVDNPRQDIPLAAVMKSPIGGFDDAELAEIRSRFKDRPFFEACMAYAKGGDGLSAVLSKKVSDFYGRLGIYRHKASYMCIHEFIEYLLEDTGYSIYLAASPGGAQRTANMRMLVQKAVSYEKTSYSGLFNFVRYIDKLQSYKEDFGEAGVLGENEDAVRIMTIHKSKGLEFPVVIVGGLGRRFNRKDIYSRVIMHPDLGIGTDRVNLDRRTKRPTLPKKVLQKAADTDMLGEELRILYVAMTRAKEKLILLGSTDSLQKKLLKFAGTAQESSLGYVTVSGAQSCLDWILPAAAVCPDTPFSIDTVRFEDEAADTAVTCVNLGLLRAEFEGGVNEEPDDGGFVKKLKENLAYEYPWKDEEALPVKMSVSELKRAHMPQDDEEGALLYEPEEPVPYIPDFVRGDGKRKASGADRGTAYHRALMNIDLKKIKNPKDAGAELARLVDGGILSKEQADMVNTWDLSHFAASPLAGRMIRAKDRGTLRAEQPFVFALPAGEISGDGKSSEPILIQGIIDAYFTEEDPDGVERTVLVDYKTDFVHGADELVSRYQSQLDYYAAALERLIRRPVKEKIIYSFCLRKEIRL